MQPCGVRGEQLFFRGHVISARQIGAQTLGLGFGDGLGLWLRVQDIFCFQGMGYWVRVRVLGCGFKVRGRKVKSRDCALASDLVRAAKKRG